MGTYWSLCAWLLWGSAAYATRDVIVIGAGASGLAAARKLTDEENINVTVLEARPDRYGGRIWTNRGSFNNPKGPEVEMGGTFVHHPGADNAVSQLLSEFGIPLSPELNESALVVREGDRKHYTTEKTDAVWDKLYWALNAAEEYGKAQETDDSMEASLRKINMTQRIASPLSQVFLAEVEFDFGTTIDRISSLRFDDDYETTADLDNYVPTAGYGQMLDMLVQRNSAHTRLDIRLGKEVTQVTVLPSKRVAVTCRDGSQFEADAAVVALPLGVLKADVVRFTPELPTRKLDAIRRMGVGVINKIILEFDRVFWPKNVYHFYAVQRNTTQRGDLTLMANFFPLTETPILVCYAVSYFGEASESLSDEEMKAVALTRLRTLFGNVVDNVTVVNMARTRWLADPFARGAYSYAAVGTLEDDWERIGEPVSPLFFCGEHTQSWNYATVNCAVESGWRAAKQTRKYLNDHNKATKMSVSYIIPLAVFLLYSFF